MTRRHGRPVRYPAIEDALLALDVELTALEAATAHRHRHVDRGPVLARLSTMPELDRITAELDVAERRLPSGSRRLLTPAERRAGTRFADFEAEVDERTERLTTAAVEARGRVAVDLDDLAARAAAGDLADVLGDHRGTRAIGELVRALDDPARAHLLPVGDAARLELRRQALGELDGALTDGYARAASEATSQGVRTAGLGGPRPAGVATDLERGADRIAGAPRRQAVGIATNTVNALDADDVDAATMRASIRDNIAAGSDATLRNEVRPEVHKAAGLGRSQAAAELPQPERIYASELMDGNTCGPCSIVDGREYATLADARLDYPAGRYVRCEGGDRCRGTLVFVWPEADITLDPPGPPWQPPPPPPPPPGPTIGPTLPAPPAPPAPTLTAEAARELERAARLEARRAEAQAVRDAEAAELDALVAEGWTREQVTQARRDLDEYRARARAEAEHAARRAEDMLAAPVEDVIGAPPRAVVRRDPRTGEVTVRREGAGGEWDWFDALSESEQKRLRRRWVQAGNPVGPDNLADIYRDHFGDSTLDAAMARWLDLNRRADAGRAMARGKMPSPSAYGDLDVDDLLADSPFDASTLFGSDTGTATRRILERYDDEAAEMARREAADEAAERLGPAPWEMTEEDYVFEVQLARDVIADPDLVPLVDFDPELGRPRFDPDTEREFARLGELIPEQFAALDLAPADLYRSINAWADQAGLRAHIEAFAEGRPA